MWAGEPQGGEITKPRLKAWVNGTQTDTRALKGRNNPLQSHTYRSSLAIPERGKTYFALSGLAAKFVGNLNPGLQPGLCYFAPLGLNKLHGDGVKTPANGLGQRDPNRYPSPEGAEQSSSIPHVPLVVGDSVRVQEYRALSGLAAKFGGVILTQAFSLGFVISPLWG